MNDLTISDVLWAGWRALVGIGAIILFGCCIAAKLQGKNEEEKHGK